MKNQIKIIIADDHQLMIDGIKNALSETPEIIIIGEALNGIQLLEMLKTKQPDIVLLDIRMPELDGLDTLEIIKTKNPDVKVIMLSQFSERSFIKKSIEYGAYGYLLKDCGKNNLIKAIKTVSIGSTCFEIHGFSCKRDNKSIVAQQLSSREVEVLELICKEFTSNEISSKLKIAKDTVNSYRARLMRKTGAKNLIGLYKWAQENNLSYLD